MNIKSIAQHHCLMFKLHDEQKWSSLRKNAEQMLILLGFSKEKSRLASIQIKNAYIAADKAVEYQTHGDHRKELKSYDIVFKNFTKANSILNIETKSIKYKVGWYKAARHRDHFKVFYNLFREHLTRFGIKNFKLAIYTFYLTSFKAYKAHNEHNWSRMRNILINYWSSILKTYKSKPPIEI